MGILEEASASLVRIQGFNVTSLVREADLGTAKNFSAAVAPAQRLVDLFKRLSQTALVDFPDEKLKQVKGRADGEYQLFQQVLDFHPDKTTADRDALISRIADSYQTAFNEIHPLIAYSLHRAADFQRLDSEARATLQSIRDQSALMTDGLRQAKEESERILEEVRATAAQAGVTQQASYFKDAADSHEKDAESWRKRAIKLAWSTGVFAALSLFVHKIPLIKPENLYDTIQIGVSKVLVFAVLSYMLYLSARNFLSHKHNSIVNRHRQQALQTYQALVDASGGSSRSSEIVLMHAASCIFGPQSTGYSSDRNDNAPSAQTVVELMGSVGGRSGGAA